MLTLTDVEGWTTAVSRKDKKRRKQGVEESVIINEESPVTEEPSPKAVEEARLEARGKKVRGARAQKSAKDATVAAEHSESVKADEKPEMKVEQPPAEVGVGLESLLVCVLVVE